MEKCETDHWSFIVDPCRLNPPPPELIIPTTPETVALATRPAISNLCAVAEDAGDVFNELAVVTVWYNESIDEEEDHTGDITKKTAN